MADHNTSNVPEYKTPEWSKRLCLDHVCLAFWGLCVRYSVLVTSYTRIYQHSFYLHPLQVDRIHDCSLKELNSSEVTLEQTLQFQIRRFTVRKRNSKCELRQLVCCWHMRLGSNSRFGAMVHNYVEGGSVSFACTIHELSVWWLACRWLVVVVVGGFLEGGQVVIVFEVRGRDSDVALVWYQLFEM